MPSKPMRKPAVPRKRGVILSKYRSLAPEAVPAPRVRVAAVPAPPAPTLVNLAFLPHVRADGTALTFPGPDPGIYDGPVKFKVAEDLQKAFMAAKPGLAANVTLVDLTKGVGSPEFAGLDHKGDSQLASVAKLLPMVAAFQLQQDLRALRDVNGLATRAEVFAEARRLWTATQTPAAAEPVVPVSGQLGRKGDLATWNGKPLRLPARAATLPNLEVIFEDDLSFEFATRQLGIGPGPCDEHVALANLEQHKVTAESWVPFLQRMKLMIGFSDNAAAASCIRDIGFPFVTSMLIQMGLWDPARDGGLWLGANYGPVALMGSPLGEGGANGSAGALAALMTLLAQDALVSPTASAAMRAMLDKGSYPGLATRSGFASGLASKPGLKVFSKLGLLGNFEYDCALIERAEGGTKLRYVAVGLNATSTENVKTLIQRLDQVIMKNNGL